MKSEPKSFRDLLAIDFKARDRQTYERVCRELSLDEAHLERDADDHPSDYERLREAEKKALCYWIEHAIVPARRVNTRRNSDWLKHEFEREGFPISNGQMKGAMLLTGYLPANIHALNWCFSIRQRTICTGAYSEDYELRFRYTLGCFDKTFALLLLKAGRLEEENHEIEG